MNIPNILTVFRVLLIPVFLFYLLKPDTDSRIIALVIFAIASITDFFDGYLARKLNQESKFGRFLDPLADKVLVVTCLGAFVYLDRLIPVWMILVIIGRDMLITSLRYLAIRKGIEVKTSMLAKAKTTFQMFSIVLILCIFIVRSYRVDINQVYKEGKKQGKIHSQIALHAFLEGVKMLPDKDVPPNEKKKVFAESAPYFVMLITTIVTLLSGLRYLFTNYKILLPPYRRRRKNIDITSN